MRCCAERARAFVPLDGEHLLGDAAHHRGGVARSGADFEHPVARRHIGRLDHQRDDIGLADRLLLADRQRAVLIGEFAQAIRQEFLARHLAHGGEDMFAADAAPAQVAIDHRCAMSCKIGHGSFPFYLSNGAIGQRCRSAMIRGRSEARKKGREIASPAPLRSVSECSGEA